MNEYAEFASDDFDVKGWINATVAGHLEQAKDSGGALGNGVTAEELPSLSSSTSHRRDMCLRAGDHVVLQDNNTAAEMMKCDVLFLFSVLLRYRVPFSGKR